MILGVKNSINRAVVGVISSHCNARKAIASREHTNADARDVVWNGDARQATAIFERKIINTRHAVGNCDARKAFAPAESRISDAREFAVLRKLYARKANTT